MLRSFRIIPSSWPALAWVGSAIHVLSNIGLSIPESFLLRADKVIE